MIALAVLFQIPIVGMIEACFSFWVVQWMQEYNLPRAPLMVAASLMLIVAAIIAPFAGRALDRWSIRGVMIIGFLVYALGFAVLPVVAASWQIVAIYGVCSGTALVMVGPLAAQTLAARWFRAHRGLAMGVVVLGPTLGALMMPPIVTRLLSEFGWRTTALIVACTSVVLAGLAWVLIEESPAAAGVDLEPDRHDTGEKEMDADEWTVPQILSNRGFWGVAIAFVGVYGAGMALNSNFASMSFDHGVDTRQGGMIFSLVGAFALVGMVVIGKLSDRIDHRLIVMVCTCLTGLGFFLMSLHQQLWVFVLGACLFGIGTSCFYSLQGAIVGQHFGARSFGRVLGLLNLLFLIGAAGGPFAGAVRDHFGSYDVFMTSAAVALPCLGLSIFLLGKKPIAHAIPQVDRA